MIQTNSMKSHHLIKAAGPIVIFCLSSCFTLSGQTPQPPDSGLASPGAGGAWR